MWALGLCTKIRLKSRDDEYILIAKDENKYKRDTALPLQVSAFEGLRAFIPANSLRMLEDKYVKKGFDEKSTTRVRIHGL